MRDDFVKEIRCSLPAAMVRDAFGTDAYWEFLIQVTGEQTARAIKATS